MILEQIANIAEIVGIVIVIVSLIYLNVQVKQNAVMLRSTAAEGVTNHLVEMYDTLISNEDMTEIFMRGLQDPGSLSKVETGRFFAWWMRANFIMQNLYFQTQHGLFEAATFKSACTLFTDMGETPGLQQFWAARKYAFDPEYVSFMDNVVMNQGGNKDYRPLSGKGPSGKK